MKRIFTKAAAFAVALILMSAQTVVGQTLYESKTVNDVYSGLRYEYSQRVTQDGLMDVHVLTVDLTQGYLEVKPISSQSEHGLKETLTRLVDTNGAAAGVNGDFFGMSGSYSAPFGVEMVNGNVTSVRSGFNNEDPKSATFFISDVNTPFIDYVKTGLKFFNDGVDNLELSSYNRVTDAVFPFYIDRNAYTTTKELDSRFPGLYKIVVENETITYISSAGETVTVPENGYVVVLSSNTASYHLHKFAVGQRAKVAISSTVDFSKIKMAISGAGKILTAGYYTEEGYYIKNRQPRTAIGLSQDQSKLILMVVDGRGYSIGATHWELAELLKEYGAFNAMHLDGGGSSAMAVKESLQPSASVKNVPSDGAQRKLINGLGVFNNSTMSEITSVTLAANELVFKDMPTRLRVYGLDKHLNKIELTEGFTIDAGDGGRYADGYFYPSRTGMVTLNASYGAFTTAVTLKSVDLAQITSTQTIRLKPGEEYAFSLTGKSSEGHTSPLEPRGVNLEVVPAGLASYADGKLTGTGSGAGYVKLSANGVERYVRLIVGTRDVALESFETRAGISYLAQPEGNAGQLSFNHEIKQTGSASLELAYKMPPSSSTQAAYAVFDEPISISGQPVGLKMTVYGDNSNNWLRGRIIDANGTAHAIDFARYIDWTGFKTVEAKIPDAAVLPIKLDRIYVAALDNTSGDMRRIYFDILAAVYPIDAGGELPVSTIHTDSKQTMISTDTRKFTDVTLLGDITSEKKPEGYQDIQNKYKAEFNTKYGETYGMYVGKTDNTSSSMEAYKWTTSYDSYKLGSVNFLNLVATNGNMYSSDQTQWQRIKGDLNAAGNNIVVMMDKNPQTTLPKKELELLHNLLAKTGRNIIVVSAEGLQSTSTVIDGVRYVNLGGLFKADGTVNEGFKTLRVRFFEDDMLYSLK